MFENRSSPLLPRKDFIIRMRRCTLVSIAVLLATLVVGMCGYRLLEKMSWPDSFANAAMILAGMGPLGNLNTTAGKIFGGIYAMFCGVIFLGAMGILLAPIAHRALHKFHLEKGKDKDQ
jgi:hypothetical protein